MSAWLGVDGGCPAREFCSWCEHDANMTSNLNPMWRAAGYPGHELMNGAPCTEAAGVLSKSLSVLKADPDRFKAMNPENGWGDYDGAVEVMEWLLVGCTLHPAGKVYVSW